MKELSFNPFPILKTKRLYLRELKITDEQEIFEIRSDEKVREFLDRAKAETIEDARAFIRKIMNGISQNEWIYWAISLGEDPKFAGSICLWNISAENSSAEIGFELIPRYQRMGIITEAIKPVINFGFNVMGLEYIDAEVAPENLTSIKLLEKSGFIRISDSRKTAAGENIKTILYRLSRSKN